MAEIIFLTGGTGLLGTYLLKELINCNAGHIIALSRGKTLKEARRRIYKALEKHSFLMHKQRFPLLFEVVRGDITKKNLGLSKSIFERLTKDVTSIYHSAALCDFNAPLTIIRKVNVKGTENILKFASLCKKNRQFKRLHHISTIAVAGDSKGIFYEKALDLGQSFNNTYEQSKFEAEQRIIQYRKKGLSITIYRLGIVTGDSCTGYTNNFKMFYQPLQIFSLQLFKEIPANKKTRHYLVPVDCVAEAIIRISLDNNSRNSTYHLTSPYQVKLADFIDIASKYLKFRKPLLVPQEKFTYKKLSPLQFSLIEPYIPYFNYKLKFNSKNANSILSKTSFKWPKIDKPLLKQLFKFCVASGFIKEMGKK